MSCVVCRIEWLVIHIDISQPVLFEVKLQLVDANGSSGSSICGPWYAYSVSRSLGYAHSHSDK